MRAIGAVIAPQLHSEDSPVSGSADTFPGGSAAYVFPCTRFLQRFTRLARRRRLWAELPAGVHRLILDHSKNEFLNLISHEFRTPLNGLLSVGELVLSEIPIPRIKMSFGRCLSSSVKEFSRFSTTQCSSLRSNVEREKFPAGLVDSSLAVHRRALQALIETAVKFSERNQSVGIACRAASDTTVVTIDSQGLSIPIQQISKFFDLFTISESCTPGGDLGLGLP
jgi:signal transduction histidine kinase